MNTDLMTALMVAAVAGPELDRRISEYESSENNSKEEMLRDLKAATNLASMLTLAGEAELLKGGVL